MKPVRIIPCLDMREGRVVKGVKFVEIRDAGDPAEAAAAYSAQGADELVMLDITATLESRETRREWVKAVARVSRTKAHSVIPHRWATSMASEVGAEIAEISSMPALAHLPTISRLTRPESIAPHPAGDPPA